MEGRLDIVLFGATGFTGKHCIPYLQKLCKTEGRNLRWGVAGRSEEKLKEVLAEQGKEIETDLSSVPIIVADVKKYESLVEMAKRARLVINACGPYRFLGYDVVKACIEAGTHHIDVSGEPEFMERVELEYNKEAKEKGIYVISACGMDSIPTDLGLIFTEEKFEGTLNSVETVLEFWNEGKRVSGPALNYGTYQTAVHSVAHMDELKKVRRELFKDKPKIKLEPKLQAVKTPHKHKVFEGWLLPFMGSDKPVARRTQLYLYETQKKRPVQVETYFAVKSFLILVAMLFMGAIFFIMSKCKFGRNLLLKYPSFFTAGMVDLKPPSEEMIKSSWFSVSFYGEGWKEKLAEPLDKYTKPCDRCILVKVKGPNPGYGSTCLCMVVSAIVVLTETDKLAGNGKGGVYTPGAAFHKTTAIKQLNENGLTFEVIYQKDL